MPSDLTPAPVEPGSEEWRQAMTARITALEAQISELMEAVHSWSEALVRPSAPPGSESGQDD